MENKFSFFVSEVRSLLDIQVEMLCKQLLTFLGHRGGAGDEHCEGVGILIKVMGLRNRGEDMGREKKGTVI